MQLENRIYGLNELREMLNISDNSWRTRRDDILEHLKLYFDYEIFNKKSITYFNIKEQYADYEPLPRKNQTTQVIEYYTDETREIVKENPWNTGANIARNIIADNRNKYNHAEKTMSRYISNIIKQRFLPPDADSEWRRLSENHLEYLPLTEEQQAYLLELITGDNFSEIIDFYADYKAGYMSKSELAQKLIDSVDKTYVTIMSQFKNRFHFVPVKVRKLEEGAWALED